MALLRVDARPLLPRLRGELTALLASLTWQGDAEIAAALAGVRAILG